MDRDAYFWQVQAGKLPLPRVAATLGMTITKVDAEAGVVEAEFEGKPEFTNPVHPVIPVPRTDERQAMLPEGEAVQDGSDTVFVKACRLIRAPGQIVIRVFIRVYRAALDEVDGLIQHSCISGAQNIAACCQR